MSRQEETYNEFMHMLAELGKESAYIQATQTAPKMISFFEKLYQNGYEKGYTEGHIAGVKATELRYSKNN
jgi:flagellar biosynthesis/type III secretory pathway protein FliH